LQIWIHTQKPCAEAQRLVQETQAALDDLNESPLLHQRLRIVYNEEEEQCGDFVEKLGVTSPALEIWIQKSLPEFDLQFIKGKSAATVNPSSSSPSSLPNDLAKALHELYAQEQIAHAVQIKTHGPNNRHARTILSQQDPQAVAGIEKQLARVVKASPAYHLTFSLFTASGAPSRWDIQKLLQLHIEPLKKALESTSEINVATQIQLYSSYSPSIQPFQIEGQDGVFLRQNDLTAFVNAAEWPLSPSIGEGPTLNFIIYVPAQKQLPLRIEGSQGLSWLVPQWGGIQIINPTVINDPDLGSIIPELLSANDLSTAFETFSSQLLSLMGVLSLEYQGQPLPLPFRLQAHKRLAGLALRMKAASSLGSLARLAQHLSSIPIPKHVAQLVENAMGNLTASKQAFAESRWDRAVGAASTSFQDSEKAFFDKSMVGQVYFPDEHKVAVYLPLLGPIGVPLLVGLIREVKGILTRLRARKG
jgi:GPI-anchor transamidase subunit S